MCILVKQNSDPKVDYITINRQRNVPLVSILCLESDPGARRLCSIPK